MSLPAVLSCYWSLWHVACIVINVRDIVCVLFRVTVSAKGTGTISHHDFLYLTLYKPLTNSAADIFTRKSPTDFSDFLLFKQTNKAKHSWPLLHNMCKATQFLWKLTQLLFIRWMTIYTTSKISGLLCPGIRDNPVCIGFSTSQPRSNTVQLSALSHHGWSISSEFVGQYFQWHLGKGWHLVLHFNLIHLFLFTFKPWPLALPVESFQLTCWNLTRWMLALISSNEMLTFDNSPTPLIFRTFPSWILMAASNKRPLWSIALTYKPQKNDSRCSVVLVATSRCPYSNYHRPNTVCYLVKILAEFIWKPTNWAHYVQSLLHWAFKLLYSFFASN